MPATDYGNFHDFCRDSTIPICNLYKESTTRGGNGFGGCELTGIDLSGRNRFLRNLGVILLDGVAMLVAMFLLWRTQRRKAAVGRREVQLFLIGYFIVSLCEVFTIGGFPLNSTARIAFTGIHLGMIVATTWMLMLTGAVGFQAIDDGTFISVALVTLSTAALFIGTGYIALDTGYNWTGFWNDRTVQFDPNREYSLYTLYLLAPLIFLFIYFVLETVLVLSVLGEKKPMFFLIAAVFLFAVGQVFTFVISTHICSGTNGKIDGSLFQTLFNILAVAMVWVHWQSITEDDFPALADGSTTDMIHSGAYSM